ncbi:UvrD-helicase domain-containing protein [Allochromatium humboldtianum]|uniref:DNA 3'-5' helicase n=1 Tax=Allochromatium humboldtianum TaxID=504901 RepID=A0A850REV5_9GAMM|nr:UvrD-helicase domain-containing protein [Allochromatium humboldtianum]NVZ11535.1 UvrD-helicase domain-containing protein [Allochromatium humboldtianum]
MHKPTTEQQAIIDSNADSLIANAFAGTGKTATLVGFAEARPQSRMLYLAFNRAVADEAKARFPSTVEARTSHSLAYGRHGYHYQAKLGYPRAFHARNILRPSLPSNESLVFSGLALEAVNRFLIASSPEISLNHVAAGRARAIGVDPTDILEAAKQLWTAMQDPKDPSVPMPHDGYLKLYQLSRPKLDRYDYILLDEAQDTNPCLFDIFAAQQTGRVLVGDQHQNIYGFRGAMNAMGRMRGEHHSLTASFRFGEPVADVANALLGVFKGETLSLRGFGGPSEVGMAPLHQQHTVYLHRTNAGLFDRAVELLHAGIAMHFVGGVKNYNFQTILDAFHLFDHNHRAIRDPFMRSFRTIEDLEEYAESVEDNEIKARLKVVKKYTFRIPRLIERLESAHEPDSRKAGAELTTAHKAKGLEWDQVVLGNDFPDLMDGSGVPLVSALMPPDSPENPLDPDEANLLYVAATRARKHLVITSQLGALLDWVHDGGMAERQRAPDPELLAVNA